MLSFLVANGQKGKSYTIHFADTLKAAQSFLLYNTIQIQNLAKDSLKLKVVLQSPEGWDIISQKENFINIFGYQNYAIPVTLKKRSNISSIWQQVNMSVESFSGKLKEEYIFHIYTEPLSKFTVTNVFNGLSLTDPNDIRFHFILKNNGNVDGLYHITFQNYNLELDKKKLLLLKPGKDSVIQFTHHISKRLSQQFTNETVRLVIADSMFAIPEVQVKKRFMRSSNANGTGRNMYFNSFDIYRADSVFSMHKTDYSNFNLGVESGLIGSSWQVSYYAAANLTYDISKTSKFSFIYRSRQFGIYNTIDRDVFTVGLKTKHWDIKAGKISNSIFFLTYGNGLTLSYSWKKNNAITVFGVKHTPGFHTTNDNAGLSFKYSIGNLIVSHDLLYNTDSSTRIQSGVFNNDIQWRTKNIDLYITGGIGNDINLLRNFNRTTLEGAFGGYRFAYKIKSISFQSQYKMYGKKFPGLYAGSKLENHGISFRNKKFGVETYYQVNINNHSYFRDTLYNTDITTFNTTKYGMKLSFTFKRSYLNAGYGWLSQSGQQSYIFSPRYKFIEMLYNLRGKKNFSLNFSTSNGYANMRKYNAGLVYFTQNSLNISYKNVGINGGYINMPTLDTLEKPVYNKTVYGGPYFTARLGKMVNLGMQYNLSKTLYDNQVNSFVGINMAYNNERARTRILVNILSPLKKANEKSINPFKYGYVNISLSKNFNIPFIFQKKYHNLETVFVEDQNANGMADLNENRIPNVSFTINNLHFISNRYGIARYRHIEKGDYTIDFAGSRLRGLIPKEGYLQVINSVKDNSITILFSKSSMISGHIDILQDSSVKELFLLDNIKLVATDRSGKKYTTATDQDGNYFFNLPAGVYIVTLNQEAFNQNYRPDKMNEEVDLIKTEKATVNFVIKQKRRQVKILDVNPGKVINTKKPEEDINKPKPVRPKH